ncbi:MAG: ABC transporter permease [Anaerolineaceae bacterium]|nr:ABC transporter permease [Anaerolineaceae bacterium]
MDNKPEDKSPKPDFGKTVLEELTKHPELKKSRLGKVGQSLLIPVLAVISGLIIGALLIIFTSEDVYAAFGQSFGAGLVAAWNDVITAYAALFVGAFGDPARMVAALNGGTPEEMRLAFYPILESLVVATPYIFAGLAVALGFRAGVFNIGAEGQLLMGGIAATYIGYTLKGLPALIHIPLALLAGAVGGGIWAFIPGWLKAKTGGHEVINTIMLNWIASPFLVHYFLSGPLQRSDSGGMPISPFIQKSAELPRFFASPIRFHLGFFVALGVAWLVWWFLFRTTWGYTLRTVGANPSAGRYAGMNISRSIILSMTLSGGLAGLAGANTVLGISHNMVAQLSSGVGFDSIALALLGNSHPLGVVFSSLLFGFLRNGATRMQVVASVPVDIISILQALIIIFIAAPAIIRAIYRVKVQKATVEGVFVTGWGGGKK